MSAPSAPSAPNAPTARARLRDRLAHLRDDDAGMSTAEYAIGTVAAAAFGAILYSVVTGQNIVAGLTGIVQRALDTAF